MGAALPGWRGAEGHGAGAMRGGRCQCFKNDKDDANNEKGDNKDGGSSLSHAGDTPHCHTPTCSNRPQSGKMYMKCHIMPRGAPRCLMGKSAPVAAFFHSHH